MSKWQLTILSFFLLLVIMHIFIFVEARRAVTHANDLDRRLSEMERSIITIVPDGSPPEEL